MIKKGDKVTVRIGSSLYTSQVVEVNDNVMHLACDKWAYLTQLVEHHISRSEHQKRVNEAWERVKRFEHGIKLTFN